MSNISNQCCIKKISEISKSYTMDLTTFETVLKPTFNKNNSNTVMHSDQFYNGYTSSNSYLSPSYSSANSSNLGTSNFNVTFTSLIG